MRYRRLSYRYTMVAGVDPSWSLLGDLGPVHRPRVLVEARWRPDADVYETAARWRCDPGVACGITGEMNGMSGG